MTKHYVLVEIEIDDDGAPIIWANAVKNDLAEVWEPAFRSPTFRTADVTDLVEVLAGELLERLT